MWLNIDLSRREYCVFWLFFKIDLCSAISFKRSRRELSIDVAKHRSMLRKYRNTHYPRFSFIPKTGIAFPKTGVSFLLQPTHSVEVQTVSSSSENFLVSELPSWRNFLNSTAAHLPIPLDHREIRKS